MKHFLSIILFFIVVQNTLAASPPYKVHIVTWDGSRVTGKLDAINDSTIAIKIYNGKVLTFSAKQAKNLKIWRPWIKLPAMIVGGAALTALLIDKSPPDRTCFPDPGYFVGIIGGSIAGLIAGDLISTKFNKRRMHISDFKKVSSKL